MQLLEIHVRQILSLYMLCRTADDWPAEALNDIVNKPVNEWKLPVHKEWPNDAPAVNSLVGQINKIQG